MRRGGTPFQPQFTVRALASRSAVSCQSSSGTMRKCGEAKKPGTLRWSAVSDGPDVCLGILDRRFLTFADLAPALPSANIARSENDPVGARQGLARRMWIKSFCGVVAWRYRRFSRIKADVFLSHEAAANLYRASGLIVPNPFKIKARPTSLQRSLAM